MFRFAMKMAWASLARRATRSLMVVLMISVSLWSLLLMQGVYDGMTEQMINNAIRSDSGDVSLFRRGYRLDPSLENVIPDTFPDGRKVEDVLGMDGRVGSFVKRLQQNGVVATARYSRNIMIYGVALAAEKKHGQLQRYLLTGHYGFGAKRKGAIVGYRLAERLHVTVGSKLILSCQNSSSDVVSISVRVNGILKTNNMSFDEGSVFIDLDLAEDFFGVHQGVSQISVMMNEGKDIGELQLALQQSFPGLDVMRWDEMYPALMQSRVIMNGFKSVVSLIIFGVSGLGILGVMMVSIIERRREIGIMLALGTEFSQIRIMVLIESLIMGFSGFVAGSLLGWVSLLYFRSYGLDLSMFSEAFEEFGMDAVTYALIQPGYFLSAFTAILSAAVISVYFPLRIVSKVIPARIINEI